MEGVILVMSLIIGGLSIGLNITLAYIAQLRDKIKQLELEILDK